MNVNLQAIKTSKRFSDEQLFRDDVPDKKTILVALDGSAASDSALPIAASLAGRWEAPLHLAHVPGRHNTEHSLVLELLSDSSYPNAYLDKRTETITSAHDLRVTREVLRSGSIARGLQSACTEDVGLLVMANTRRTALSRFLFGSVSHRLIGRLRVPLLLVPPANVEAGWNPRRFFRRILVPLNRFDRRENVLGVTESLARVGTDCFLLHVFPMQQLYQVTRDGPSKGVLRRHRAWRELRRAKDLLKRRGVEAYMEFVAHSQSPTKAIVEHIDSLKPDLVVLAARPRYLPWWMRGGVPEYVARHVNVPVLIVPSEFDHPFMEKENDANFHSN